MFQSEDIIRKDIAAPDGDTEFQIRFMRHEQVGVLTGSSGKSWFLLDSKDFWYDVIQKEYPAKKRCSCKNDFFRLSLAYTPRLNTEDYRQVELTAYCTACGKKRKLGIIEIDYSPSSHLFAQPLVFCPEPRLKCKTYTLQGYWTKQNLKDITDFLLGRNLHPYCNAFDPTDKTLRLREITVDELHYYLFDGGRFVSILFSREPLDIPQASNSGNIDTSDAFLRKQEVFRLNCPIRVWGYGDLYSIDYCSEYVDSDCKIQPKSKPFSRLAQDFHAYSRQILRKA